MHISGIKAGIRLALAASLASCVCAQIPSTYTDLYSTLKQDLNDWQSTINMLCSGCAAYPWFGAGELVSANSNNGPNMVNSSTYLTGLDAEILMHKALGVKAIAVEVSFPMLYPGFFPCQGTTYNQWASFYSTVAQHIRNQGLQVIVESQTMIPTGIASNWGTSVQNFYASFTSFSSYAAARAGAIANIAAVMNPDYFVLQEEPDTEAGQTGEPVTDVNNAVTMLNGSVAAARGTAGFTGKVGAGVGSWFQQYAAFANAYTQQACGPCVSSKLDFLDIHLFPINQNGSCSGCPNACVPCGSPDFARTNAMAIVATAATATNYSGSPMQMTMSQGWLRKVRDTEWPPITIIDGSYDSGDVQEARDVYSFWETSQSGTLLDQAWLHAVESLANYAHFIWLCPFNSQNWSAYLTWSTATAINNEGVSNPTNTPSAIYYMDLNAANTARAAALYTPVAYAWYNALVPSDVTPPTAPSGLSATGVSAVSLWLNWNSATDNVGVGGYHIYRNGVQIALTFTSPYQDTGLTPGTTYNYNIYAFDLANNISPAASLSVTTLNDSTPPTVPTGLTAQPVSPSQINLMWNASTDSNSSVAGYYIYRSGSQIGSSTVTSYQDTGLTPSTTYTYTVAAYDPALYTSGQSSPVSATTLADTTPPTVPTGLAATTVSSAQINLSWTASTDPDSAVAYYKVYQNGSQIGTSATANYPSAGLAPSTTYSYTVSAVDPSGNTSAQSSMAQGTTSPDTTPPSVPTGLTATVISTTQINLSWMASTDPDSPVAGYNIYKNGTLIGTTSTTSFQSTGLYGGVSYSYRVSAFDPANNASAECSPVSATTPPDTTPPTVPTGLSGQALAPDQISLSWNASTDPDSPVSGYFIYRNGTKIASATVTSYLDTSLQASTTYTYTVSAYDPSVNTSGQSAPVSITTLVDTTPPTVPTGLTAAAVSTTQINLSWTASTDPDSMVYGYYVYRNGIKIATATTTSYQDSGLTPSTTYTYTVAALDPSHNVSAQCAPVSAVTDITPPSIPTGVTAQTISATQINVSWTASTDPDSPVAGYNVYQNGTNIGTTTTTSFHSTGLTPATTYTYRISAYDPANNTSGQSSPASATTLADTTPPSIPTGLSGNAVSSSQISLSWTASTDPDSPVAGYNIYRNGAAVGTSTTTSYQDSGLAASTTYSYTVSAFDPANNTSAQSSAILVTTLASNTPALSSTSAIVGSAAGSGTVLLAANSSWTASSNSTWLHLVPGSTSGSTSATIQFNYDANANAASQTGTLTIAGITFTVTQAGSSYTPVTAVTALVTAGLNKPQGVAADSQGNVYIADTVDNAVKQWSAATQQVTTLVSSGLNAPAGIAVDGSGNLYVADSGNNAIKKWTANTQQVTTLTSGLSAPAAVAVDGGGNVYIADTGNGAIKEWNPGTQQVTTLVSSLKNPGGVAVDVIGNLYFANSGSNALAEWHVASQQVSTLASSGLNGPTGVALDGEGNAIFSDTGNNALKQWNAASKQVTALLASGLSTPVGVAVDPQGNFYVADENNSAVRKITPGYLSLGATGVTEGSAAGNDSVSFQVLPSSLAVTAASDQTWLTVTGTAGSINFSFTANDSASSRIAHINALGVIITVTQNADTAASMTKSAGDGQSTPVGQVFPTPLSVTVTDNSGSPVQGVAVTFSVTAGSTGASGSFASAPVMPIVTDQNGNATAPMLTANSIAGGFTVTASNGAQSATFTLTNVAPSYSLASNSALVGSAAGSGTVLLLANYLWTAASNASWLTMSPASGNGNAVIQFNYAANTGAASQTGTLTIAGQTFTVTQAGISFAPVAAVSSLVTSGLNNPQGVAVDGQGNVYIADTSNNALKEWKATTQQVTTLVSSGLNAPAGVAVDGSGNVYLADTGNNAIKKWTASTQQVTTLLGSGLYAPAAVALDGSGNVYIADTGNNAIREWNPSTQQVTTLLSSGLKSPAGLTLDVFGNLYFSNTNNNTVTEYFASNHGTTTLVNSGLNGPLGIDVDGAGNVDFADIRHNALKQWNPSTKQTATLLSTGLNNPAGVALDSQANIYVADSGNNAIRKVTLAYVSLGSSSVSENAAAGSDSVSVQVLPSSLPVAATSDQSWLTITGTSGGSVGFSFTANTSATRTAHISVFGQTITVTQNGDVPATVAKTAGDGQSTYTGQPFPTALSVTVKDSGGNPVQGAAVTFAANAGATGASGIFASTPVMPILTDQNGNATAPVLTANSIAGAFTVTATAGGAAATFTLTNNAYTYTLVNNSALVGSAAGSGSVLLLANNSWTASSNSSWMTVSPASGTGNALIQFSYTANSGAASQTGTLTIAGQTFTVTQAGTAFAPVAAVTSLITSGLNNPQGVAVDGQGNVYIADTSNNALKQWKAATQQVTTLVSSGLNAPAGVALDGSGNVYLADTGNNAIKKWTAGTQQVSTLVSTGLNAPAAVALDGSGNVYIADTGNNAIREWNPSTQQVTTLLSSGLKNPAGLTLDVFGNLYFSNTNNNTVTEYFASNHGTTTLVNSGLNGPMGITIDGGGNVDFADIRHNSLKQWNAATKQTGTLLSTGLNSPAGVAVDSQANMYVADASNNAIRKITLAYVSLGSTSVTENAAAGSDSVSVQVLPSGLAIAATSDQSWLTITGTAGGSITFSFTANTSLATRTAHITVFGLNIMVTQNADTAATITKTAGDGQSTLMGQVFPNALSVTVKDSSGNALQGAAVNFTVTAGSTGASGSFASTPVMPILTDQNGNATAPVLTANSIAGTFTVTATAGGVAATFTLTNNGYTYTLVSNLALVGSAAGTGTVLLLANSSWTTSSNASWLMVSPASGSGNAVIQFTYTANTGAASQTGTLTIAGQTFTVTQAGTSFTPVTAVTALITSGLSNPQGVAVDGQGNVYVADTSNNALKEWKAATQQVTTLVSTGLNAPAGVALDGSGNVYLADTGNNAIKKWTAGTQQVSTLVSTGLNAPAAVALDPAGNVYVADTGNNAIREWNPLTQQVTTLLSAGLKSPAGLTLDAFGNLYFSNTNNNTLTEYFASNHGTTTLVNSGLNGPMGITIDGGGNVDFADIRHNALKQWNAVTKQTSTLLSTGLNSPAGVALDSQANIYVADAGNNAIRKVTLAYVSLGSTSVSENAAAGSDSVTVQVLPSSLPVAATSDQSWLTITGTTGGSITFSFMANTSLAPRTAHISVFGVTITVTQSADTPASVSKNAGDGQSTLIGQVFSTALTVTVKDSSGNPMQGVGVTFTVTAGSSGAGGSFASMPVMPILTDQNGNATAPVLTANGIAGTFTVTATAGGVAATFTLTNNGYTYTLVSNSALVGSAAGTGTVLLLANSSWTASSNATWLMVSPASGSGNAVIQFTYTANTGAASQTGTLTIAGQTFTVTQAGTSFMPVTAVTALITSGLSNPQGVAVDGQGNVYIADTSNSALKEWKAATQQVTTLVSSGLNAPAGVALDGSGNVYLADTGNNAIKKWTAGTQQVTTLLGSGLNAPAAVALDAAGNVYIADTGNNAIREWNPSTQQVTTLLSAGLKSPAGLTLDAFGNLYFSNTNNNTVTEYFASNHGTTTLVNSGLNGPLGIAVDGAGNVDFADIRHNALKQWNASTKQTATVLSTGLNSPAGVALDSQANMYIADAGNNAIRKVTLAYVSLGSTSVSENAAAGSDSVSVQVLPSSLPVAATSDQSWLTITGTTGGSITFSFTANTSGDSRTAHINVFGQSITVTQSG